MKMDIKYSIGPFIVSYNTKPLTSNEREETRYIFFKHLTEAEQFRDKIRELNNVCFTSLHTLDSHYWHKYQGRICVKEADSFSDLQANYLRSEHIKKNCLNKIIHLISQNEFRNTELATLIKQEINKCERLYKSKRKILNAKKERSIKT